VNLANHYVPIELRYFYSVGLYFAWAETGVLPNCVPRELRAEGYLRGSEEKGELLEIRWGQIMTDFLGGEVVYEPLERNEEGLERLVGVLDRDGDRAQVKYKFDDTQYILLEECCGLHYAWFRS